MRVLLAEDNRLERTILRAAVLRLGHTCIEASDGDSAWDAFCLSTPDVIISDWVMPGMQGPEFCRRVRDAAVDRPPYFILQTMRTQREHVVEARQAGVDAYLAKPVSLEDLTARLAAAARSLAARQAASDDGSVPIPADHSAVPIIDMDDLADYRDPAGGSSELLRELVQVFRDDTPAYLDALQDANTRGNAEDVDRVVHTLKGSSSGIGARQMYAVCVELERTSEANVPRTHALVQELHTAFERALEMLERVIAA
jgi:CheY-like chemotaxis protein/HPt (histidine-containing phosphotransfer) domain-containing protein